MKLYIISNRLPVKAVAEQDTFVFSRSEGGLTTGLNSLQGNYEKHWVGVARNLYRQRGRKTGYLSPDGGNESPSHIFIP